MAKFEIGVVTNWKGGMLASQFEIQKHVVEADNITDAQLMVHQETGLKLYGARQLFDDILS